MTAIKYVVEIDSFSTDQHDPDFGAMREAGVVGVLIKTSQGLGWEADAWEMDVQASAEAGLLVGVLHYLTPQKSSPKDEVSAWVPKLSDHVYELGAVLEIEPPFPEDLFGFSTDLGAALESIEAAGYEAGLRCDGATMITITGAPWAARWWCGKPTDLAQIVPFAEWVPNGFTHPGGASWPAYGLTSTRGLNLGGVRLGGPLGGPGGSTAASNVETDTEHPEDGHEGQDQVGGGVDLFGIPHGQDDTDGDDDEADDHDEDDGDQDWRAAAREALG